MQVNENKSEGLKRSYTIKIPANDIVSKNQAKVNEMQKMAKLPGFRPGKVPVSYIEKRFGSAISGETIEEMVKENTSKLVEEKKLRLASQPKIDVKEYKEGEDLEYNFECEVMPEYKPMDYSKVKVNNYKIIIPDSEITKQIELRLKSEKDFQPVSDKAAKAKKGSGVKIDYKGFIDGEQFEGGTAEGHQLELGSKSFIDNFEEQLVGLKAGDEKKVKVKFPDDYHAEQFKGKAAEFEVKVQEVLEVVTPKLDDEFAKKQGAKDLKDYKATVKATMEGALGKQSKDQLKKELFDYFEEKVDIEMPESMVDEEYKALIQQYLSENKLKDEEEAEAKDSKEFKKLKKDYVRIAKRRVKVGVILSEIGRINEITVTNNEALDSMKEQFASYPGNPDDILSYYKSNPQALDYLKGPILEDKVVDFIAKKVTLTDKEVTIEQFKRIYND